MYHANSHARQKGLTLIEVMMALGVLVILTSSIFMVVQTALKSVLLIDGRSSREDEITNLIDILRSNFRNLPSNARLIAVPVTQGRFPEFLLVVKNAPGFLRWLPRTESNEMMVLLSLRQDEPDGQWRVCLKRFEAPLNFPEDIFDILKIKHLASTISWLELVGNFQKIKMRFYNAITQKWEDHWQDPNQRPALIEWTIQYEHPKDARSATAIFWIPPIKGGIL